MTEIRYAFEAILAFMEQGGDVQWFIMGTTCAMWILIVERFIYFGVRYKDAYEDTVKAWNARPDRTSWHARQIRKMTINRLFHEVHGGIPLAQTLVAICPLLGLLGTVVGMIEVFDVMKLSGNSNARALAGGVSQATITTMAGMVAALSGLFITTQLERKAQRERQRLEDALTSH